MGIDAREGVQKEDLRYWRVARTHRWTTGVAGQWPVCDQLLLSESGAVNYGHEWK